MIDAGAKVWTLKTEDFPRPKCDAAISMLSTEENAKARRLRFEADRIGYLAAHVLTRLVLSRAAGCGPEELRFETEAYGRPIVVSPSSARRLHFSLSHTAGLVGVAVCDAPVGIDIERLDRQLTADVIDHVASDAERSALTSLDPAEKRCKLLQLWTLKEACLKALGTGFASDAKRLGFKIGEDDRVVFHPGENETRRWEFLGTDLHGTHRLAVCHVWCGRPPQLEDGNDVVDAWWSLSRESGSTAARHQDRLRPRRHSESCS